MNRFFFFQIKKILKDRSGKNDMGQYIYVILFLDNKLCKTDFLSAMLYRGFLVVQGSPSATFNNDALKKSVANRPERHSVHA